MKKDYFLIKKLPVLLMAFLLSFAILPRLSTGTMAGETVGMEEKAAPEGELTAQEILSNSKIIAHGMGIAPGGEMGHGPLNCLEGFKSQYDAGVRVFEADFQLTRDGKVVLRHDWWDGQMQEGVSWINVPTRNKFCTTPILGKYTSLSFRNLLLLMVQYPDVCIITDTKYTDSEVFLLQFDSMMEDAKDMGLSYLLGRIVVQVYSQNMFKAMKENYPFTNFIYTLYQEQFDCTDKAFEEKASYCAENGICAITMADSRWRDSFAPIADKYGIKVYLHTINDKKQAQAFIAAGVDGIYSDSLTPSDLP